MRLSYRSLMHAYASLTGPLVDPLEPAQAAVLELQIEPLSRVTKVSRR